MKRLLFLAIATWLVPAMGMAQSKPQQYEIKNDGGSRIQFVSEAPLETITGVTSHVTGVISGDPSDLSTVKGEVSAKVDTIKTGIDLRDEHLYSDSWLDAKKYPQATFKIAKVTGAKALVPNQSTKAKVHGTFTIHGVSKPVVADVSVRLVPLNKEMTKIPGMTGDVIMIQGQFTVKLPEHKVKVPAIVRLKVSEEIQITVNLRAIKKQ